MAWTCCVIIATYRMGVYTHVCIYMCTCLREPGRNLARFYFCMLFMEKALSVKFLYEDNT
jgi:hypothetical protein